MKEEASNYLINLVPKCETNTRTRNSSIPTFNWQTNFFKYSFFLSTLNDWFNLDLNTRNSESISIFKSKLLSFIFPVQTNIYNIFDPKGLIFLTRLRLGFSHLNEHRSWHNFQDCLNPLCSCSLEIEDTSHYLLHCHHFSCHRVALMNSVKSICDNFDSVSDNVKEDLLSYGGSGFDEKKIFEDNYKLCQKYWKIPRILFWSLFQLMSNFLLFTYNSDHLVIIISCQFLLEFSISNFDFSPTAQYIVAGALLHVFFVVLFLVNIIIIKKIQVLFVTKPFFWLSLNFLSIILEIRLRFS